LILIDILILINYLPMNNTVPINLEFPALVSLVKNEEKEQYQSTPLFFSFISYLHPRFEGSVSKMKSAIQNVVKGYILEDDTLDDLIWFRFNPTVDYQIFNLTIPIPGKKDQLGRFGVAFFELNNITFASLPHFNGAMYVVEKSTKSRSSLEKQATKVISQLLKKYQANDPTDFDFNNYLSPEKEFVTSVEIPIQAVHDDFSFISRRQGDFSDIFSSDEKMDGETEVWKISKNLNNDFPKDLSRAFYQEKMIERLENLLFDQPFKNTPIAIVGKEGVGKKSVIHETLFQHIEEFDKKSRTIWHLDPTRIITGMSIVGMWQKRMEAVLNFIKNPYSKNKGSSIILIDNAVSMLHIGKSAQNNMTVNDVLKPYLEKRIIQLVILATPEEWKIIQEKDRRFTDLFQLIRMEEPDLKNAAKMALENRKILENSHNCTITIKAVQSLFDFRRNYLKRKSLPGSIINIMRQLAVKHRGQKIDVLEVRAEFETFSGLNQDIFDLPNTTEEEDFYQKISLDLVGQPKAVATLANVIHTIKARLTAPDKPLGSFMFIGPTGVGKTQAAKVLSKFLTGSESTLMQFDMNEFIDHTAIQRLIGDAQNPEGQLTGKVRYQPFGVVLLDEIEKAHPKVLDLLLQLLDDARLTDSLGRTIDFSNIIIIMTSNIGANQVSSQAGFRTSTQDDGAIYRKAVEDKFRPEFVNRIDEIVIFDSLKMQHILDIARLQIKDLLSRDGFVRRTTILNIEAEALEWVAQRGFNSRMGGRALKRQIEKDLTALTAAQLVSNYSTSPILFEISLLKNRLVPKISPLEFVALLEENWFPELPEPEKGKGFYLRLIRVLETIQRQIQRMESDDSADHAIVDYSNSHHYSFKEKIAETKERIQHLSLGFRDKKFHLDPAIPLRLKRNSIWSNSDKILKENYKDLFFQQEGLAEISEVYNRTNIQYNTIQSEFLNSFLEVSFLKLFSKDFIKNQIQKVTIQFESAIHNSGQEQIEYLFKLYDHLFDYLRLEKESDEENHLIHLEGYSLFSFLKGEEGIHLFHMPYENPIPIRVILDFGKPKNKTVHNQVIRGYDSQNALTDFRTNFINAVNITNEEFSLLVYAGMSPSVRNRLIPSPRKK
jgi:ATP-dependent Clp protease ATP-binding subunit ClpC